LEPIELARHFTRAIETGDIEAVRACYSEDAQIWHNFDDVKGTDRANLCLGAISNVTAANVSYRTPIDPRNTPWMSTAPYETGCV
jgi:ketosteroid isomerase-like protein